MLGNSLSKRSNAFSTALISGIKILIDFPQNIVKIICFLLPKIEKMSESETTENWSRQ